MSATIAFLCGCGMIGIGLIARKPNLLKSASSLFPELNSIGSKYYRGGFEAKMTKEEAAKILGISPSAPVKKVKDAHKRLMILNHPDKGGSPYMAQKINEAKDFLDKK